LIRQYRYQVPTEATHPIHDIYHALPSIWTVLQQRRPEYKTNISDRDAIHEDSYDSDVTVDDKISVTLKPSETDKDTDVVDSNGDLVGYQWGSNPYRNDEYKLRIRVQQCRAR
jgi:hypothetical protein